MKTRLVLLPLATLVAAWPFNHFSSQRPLQLDEDELTYSSGSREDETSTRRLVGRFLHITDLHLDRFYRENSSPDDDACHRGKGDAGYFGAEQTECDLPETLLNATFSWIKENIRDQIDFVVWTGDSARHDNDERIPRTQDQILGLNQIVVDRFLETFGPQKDDKNKPKRDLVIPIVPNIGNNDIMPHNIFKKGPNTWTKNLAKVWHSFIPEEQRHTFLEGGWFYTEVIPDKLAVFSLNTLYFYTSNNAVDGCKDKSEPGYQHMEWLRVQLQLLRKRGMKAILMGHVPPARNTEKQNWDDTCWQKYTLWLQQYRDIVVGSFYGHMNVDHFSFQDTEDISIDSLLEANGFNEPPRHGDGGGEMTTQSRTGYLTSLREDWAQMPFPPSSLINDEDDWAAISEEEDRIPIKTTSSKKSKKKKDRKKEKKFLKKIGGPWAERYAVSLVSPSMVPNYFPTLRVFEYNITGLENTMTWAERRKNDKTAMQTLTASSADRRQHHHSQPQTEQLTPDVSETDWQTRSRKEIPDPPSKSSPPGPGYSNQPLTLLRYTQYFANLTTLNREAHKSQAETLEAPNNNPKIPFNFEVEYDTRDDEVYHMNDLTVRSFFKLATRIAKKGSDEENILPHQTSMKDKLFYFSEKREQSTTKTNEKKPRRNRIWYTFLSRAFVGSLNEEELNEIAS